MPKSKQQKEKDLAELTGKLKAAKAAVFTDFRGTTVKNIDILRRASRKENVFSKVYKLTLLKKALQQAGIAAPDLDYKAPVILSISEEDETTPARVIKNLSKDIKTLNVLQGVIDNRLISKLEVQALADLPSKQQLLGQLVRTINAPISGFVNVLAGNIRGLMNVLNALAQKG